MLEVEDDIQLAYVPVVLVHLLNVTMHNLERYKFIVRRICSSDEK